MTHQIRIAGGLIEPMVLIAQNRYHVFLKWRGEIVLTQPEIWKRLLDSGRVLEVGNG